MAHKFNKKIEESTVKWKVEKGKYDKQQAFNRYWESVNKKMRLKSFWCFKVFKRQQFKMSFPHVLLEYDKTTRKFYNADLVKDNECLIELYASRNGLTICDEKLFGNKSVYWFKKTDV